jgi:hypothetical protein
MIEHSVKVIIGTIRLFISFTDEFIRGSIDVFNSDPIEKSDAAGPQIILARMNELKIEGCEVIIYILDQVRDDIYHVIKFFGNVKIGKTFSSSLS